MRFETCASISRASGAAKRSFVGSEIERETERKNEPGVVGARCGSATIRRSEWKIAPERVRGP